MFTNLAIFAAVSFASLSGGDAVEDYAGMCGDAIEAVQAIESAPVGEIPAAINAVYEADMRCAADTMPDGTVHRVEDLESALVMCAAPDVVDTRGCAQWALSEY